MQGVQDPSQRSIDNPKNVRREAGRQSRNKKRSYLKAKIEELEIKVRSRILWTCIGASVTLRRFTSLELM